MDEKGGHEISKANAKKRCCVSISRNKYLKTGNKKHVKINYKIDLLVSSDKGIKVN